jgi:hypothetical protein
VAQLIGRTSSHSSGKIKRAADQTDDAWHSLRLMGWALCVDTVALLYPARCRTLINTRFLIVISPRLPGGLAIAQRTGHGLKGRAQQ